MTFKAENSFSYCGFSNLKGILHTFILFNIIPAKTQAPQKLLQNLGVIETYIWAFHQGSSKTAIKKAGRRLSSKKPVLFYKFVCIEKV